MNRFPASTGELDISPRWLRCTKLREKTTEREAKGSVAFKNYFEGKNLPRSKWQRGGLVGKVSRRVVLGQGLVQGEGNRDNVDDGS